LPPSPQGEDIPEVKKRRIDEPLPTSIDEAARKAAAPDVSVSSLLLPLMMVMIRMQIL
jgi:hypothetical protein